MNKKIILVSPADSLALFPKEVQQMVDFIESKGWNVDIAPNALKSLNSLNSGVADEFNSMPPKERAEDINWAFAQNPTAILSFIGGFNSNDILRYLNWSDFEGSAVKFIGHSDITVLCNALYAKSGITTWTGVSGINFCVKETREETWDSLQALLEGKLKLLKPKKSFQNSFDSSRQDSIGWTFVNPKDGVEGISIGGNLDTLGLLQGTEYMPKFDQPIILVLEDDDLVKEETIYQFKRSLISLLMQDGVLENLQGLVFGRFSEGAKLNVKSLKTMLSSIPELDGIPTMIGVEIDHCLPKTLLPIGSKIKLNFTKKQIEIL
jgi:muramoyltetrapeptide carboxypeptidase